VHARYGAYTLYECPDCELVFSDNGGRSHNAQELYDDFYKNEIGGRFSFGIEFFIRLLRLFRALKIYTLYRRAKSILDIGSGRGYMLYYLKKYFGFAVAEGTQISRPAVEFSRNKLGLTIYDKDLLELPLQREKYDVVTIWHVLEHVEHPEHYIQRIFQILKPGGKLLIEVPNYNSWTRRRTGFYWLGLDLEYHLFFFTPSALARLVRKHGFAVKRMHTFSFEYSTFISAQSFVSKLTGTDQAFFQWLQNKRKLPNWPWHLFLFAVLAPISFLINCALYFSKRGEVLLLVAEK